MAYKRIQAARAARLHPEILEEVRRGDLHLTAVGLLTPKLTRANCEELIKAARHRSADEIRSLLADREPRPAVPTVVRRIPEPSKPSAPPPVTPQPTLTSARRSLVPEKAKTEPLGSERYRVQFTADREMHTQLEELRALMRHQIPMAMSEKSWPERSLSCSSRYESRSSQRPRRRDPRPLDRAMKLLPDTSQRESAARSGIATGVAVPTSRLKGGAATRVSSWNSIMSKPGFGQSPTRWRALPCAAVRTINSALRSTSGRCTWRSPGDAQGRQLDLNPVHLNNRRDRVLSTR